MPPGRSVRRASRMHQSGVLKKLMANAVKTWSKTEPASPRRAASICATQRTPSELATFLTMCADRSTATTRSRRDAASRESATAPRPQATSRIMFSGRGPTHSMSWSPNTRKNGTSAYSQATSSNRMRTSSRWPALRRPCVLPPRAKHNESPLRHRSSVDGAVATVYPVRGAVVSAKPLAVPGEFPAASFQTVPSGGRPPRVGGRLNFGDYLSPARRLSARCGRSGES